MFSLFEEQLRQESAAFEHLTASGAESFAESLSYFPEIESYQTGPERYLELLGFSAVPSEGARLPELDEPPAVAAS